MQSFGKGTVCMVTGDCSITEIGENSPRCIRGRLAYGRGVLGGGRSPDIFSRDRQIFYAFECKPGDLAPIDPRDLDRSLSAAFRKSKPLGTLNPSLKVPLLELRKELSEYERHFREFSAGV